MTESANTQTAVTVITGKEEYAQIIKLVTDGLSSRHSVRAYEQAITNFLDWREERGRPKVNKATVSAYKRHLADMMDAGKLAPSTINQRLSAVRRLAAEASDNGLIDTETALAIARIKGVKTAGIRAGDWLQPNEVQAILEAPDAGTLKGTRDRAILSVLFGAGLRRTECAALEVRHLAERDGHPCIVDLVGKGKRIRTVPIAPWIDTAVRKWLEMAGIESGRVFRPINKGGRMTGDSMTPQAVFEVLSEYAPAGITPHDARRTFARLAYMAKAPLDQVSASLGHASLVTTQRYLGIHLELGNGKAPSDKLPFGL